MHEDFFFMFIRKGIIVLLSLWLDKDKNSAVSRSGEKGWNEDKVLSSLAVSP